MFCIPKFYTVRDEITGREETVDQFDLEDAILSMLDIDQDGVVEAVDAIVRGVGAGEYVGDYEEFLGITVERETVEPEDLDRAVVTKCYNVDEDTQEDADAVFDVYVNGSYVDSCGSKEEADGFLRGRGYELIPNPEGSRYDDVDAFVDRIYNDGDGSSAPDGFEYEDVVSVFLKPRPYYLAS